MPDQRDSLNSSRNESAFKDTGKGGVPFIIKLLTVLKGI